MIRRRVRTRSTMVRSVKVSTIDAVPILVMSTVLLTATHGPVTTLTLHRPEKRNALNVELLDALGVGIRQAESDATQRILVLRGAGPTFCAGLDLGEAATRAATTQRSAERIHRVLEHLATTRLITIAAVHGAAIAGGAGLMNACDFALATRETQFGYPEVRRGLVPALVMTFLRRQLRERDVRELLLLGERFDADKARVLGLLNRVVPDAVALDVEVKTLTLSLLQGAPGALSATKALLRQLWPATLADDLATAHASHLHARNSPEAKEGMAAFAGKRAPNWAPRES